LRRTQITPEEERKRILENREGAERSWQFFLSNLSKESFDRERCVSLMKLLNKMDAEIHGINLKYIGL